MDVLQIPESANGNSSSSIPNETRGKVITCKAAVVWGAGEPLVIEEICVEPPQKMEVRVKILFTSICHTDVSAWNGENGPQQLFPRILGHEASGVVESVGEGVEEMREGDKVIVLFNGECGECRNCKSEKKNNMCAKYRVNPYMKVMENDGKSRFYKKTGEKQETIYHFLNTSTFSEYTVIHSAFLLKLPTQPPPSLKSITLLSCCLSTGVGAVWNAANVEAGSSIAVFGLGAVGLAAAEGARNRGVSKIIGVDINPDKFIKGKAMGITDFINPTDLEGPVHEKIREMSGGGVDYSFECAGNLGVLREAFLSTHDGWGLTIVLGIHYSPQLLPLHPMELFDGRRITGSVLGGFKAKSQLPHFVQECMSGAVNMDGFITHELPFSKINEAFQLLIDGKSLRCVLNL